MPRSRVWPLAEPDFEGQVLAHWVVTTASELTSARRELAQRASVLHGDGRGGSITVADALTLLMSELVTNVLRHASPPAEVTVLRNGGGCLLDVADRAPDSPPSPEHDRSPGLGGHGLPLVAMLAEDRGWYVHEGRKHVWACLRT
ncbi:ATP-binding protein [Pseudokineococcus sp. 1T1Z-3]|uniref:ATP-binding protein n=1 Tax=Pseudokineococcus sp. 1T1Z-3 TaxID=3132745 RepID=UPI0030952190